MEDLQKEADNLSGFQWKLKEDQWILFSPNGNSAAQVFLSTAYDGGRAWYAWDISGEGTGEGAGATIVQAKAEAEQAVLKAGKHLI